jgi:hypothetical protein
MVSTMSRSLTIQRSIVPLPERKRYLERLRSRRRYYEEAGCRFSVFEEIDLHGAFIEFIEANDADTLSAALAGAPEQSLEAARMYQEVELK